VIRQMLEALNSIHSIEELEELRQEVLRRIEEEKNAKHAAEDAETAEIVKRWAPDVPVQLLRGPMDLKKQAIFQLYQPRKRLVWLKTFPVVGGGFAIRPLTLRQVREWQVKRLVG
jgi:hypothetical protein